MSSRKWLIIFGTVALVILFALNWGYRQALESVTAEMDRGLSDRLLGLATDLAGQIDPDIGLGLLSVDDFVAHYEKVQAFRRTHDLPDVRLLDTNFVDLLTDEPDSLAVAIVSRLDYPTFLAAISGIAGVSETYQWEDGYYKSAYAPVLTDDGKVAAVVRLEADADFFSVIEVFERGLWLSHILSIIFVIAVGGLFFWFFRRQAAWERQLLLSEKLLAMGRMASVIAHEIRNPLGIIKATAQRLAKLEPEKQKPLLDFIPEETDRLDRILTGYLQFADIRVDSPKAQQLGPIVDAVVGRTRHYCHDHEINLIVPATDILVVADGDSLARALENLVRNAVDASEKGATVEVGIEHTHEQVHIAVADRGSGVPRKDRKRIFEPFHTTRAQGSGLGLYAAKNSIEKMGGKLIYQPRKQGGSRFIITLPAAEPGD